MFALVDALKSKNDILFYFGLACIVVSIIFLGLARVSAVMLDEVNAWYKPFKFAASIGIYSWTMALFCSYLTNFNTTAFSWAVVILLGFEIVYIAIQAGRGARSHFNTSSPLYAFLFFMMGLAASLVTLYTAYIGCLFFTRQFPMLPSYYVIAIRWSIFIFVVFSFEGAIMGGRMSHTIGGPDGNHGIPVLNWSRKFGDPRVAHFIGMHAIQVLPLAAFYLLKNDIVVSVVALLYALLAVVTMIQALNGKPAFFVR